MNRALNRLLRSSLRLLRSSVAASGHFPALRPRFLKARGIVALYYISSVYIAAELMVDIRSLGRTVEAWDFLWPLSWVDADQAALELKILGTLCFASSLLVAVFQRFLVFRLLFCASFLLACTVPNSWAGINHPYHAWFWVSVLLVFLPSGAEAGREGPSRRFMMSYVTTFFTAQVMLFFFYAMSGAWKVGYGVMELMEGKDGGFSLGGLAYNLADRIVQTDTSPLLAEFAIEHFGLAWLGFLAVMFIQVSAVAAVFRPRLHAPWGGLIVLFHFGTWLLMDIIFTSHILLLVMFFVFSPFRPERFNLRKTIADVPLLGRPALICYKVFSRPLRGAA